MKARFTFIGLGMLAVGSAAASPLTPEQALARIGSSDGAARMAQAHRTLVYTAESALTHEATAYVFTGAAGQGFSILSADSRALPILGYSSETFDPANIPPGLKWLLSTYADQLKQADEMDLPDYQPGGGVTLSAVEPLVKTQWNQLEPYNGMTPKVDNVNCPTGCVATSMAQAMNYFQFPAEGRGKAAYKWGKKTLSLIYAGKPIDWANMLPTYKNGNYTEEQATAVSFLMKAVGYSVEMDYSADQSGAFSERIINALVTNFSYDPGVWYATRSYYSQKDWYTMLHTNLVECGPIIYNGSSPLAGGHSFICDGYDGEGLFHINWGWGGLSDGYFSIDILGPGAQGTGGSIGNFSYSQDAVLGMKPGDGSELPERPNNLQQCGSSTGTMQGETLYLSTTEGANQGWLNATSGQDIKVEFGIEVKNLDSENEPSYLPAIVRGIKEDVGDITGAIEIGPGYYMSAANYNLTADLASLADGLYKITVCTKDVNVSQPDWQPILIDYGYSNFVYVEKRNGQYTVTDVAPALIEAISIEAATVLYKGKRTKFIIEFNNPTDMQLSACVTPQLHRYDRAQYQAASRIITVEPNSTLTYDWTTSFYKLVGSDGFFEGQEFTLELMNQATRQIMGVSEEIPMMPMTDNLVVNLDDLSIPDVERTSLTVGDKKYNRVYLIPDYKDFKVNFEYTIKRGYFDTSMVLAIYEKDEDDNLIKLKDLNVFEGFLNAGDVVSTLIDASYEGALIDKVYFIRAEYMLDEVPLYLGQAVVSFLTSSVEGIVSETEEAPTYFTIQGMPVEKPVPGQLVIEKRGSKTLKKIF